MQPPNNDFPSYNDPLPSSSPFGSSSPQPAGGSYKQNNYPNSTPPHGRASLAAIGEAWGLFTSNLANFGTWIGAVCLCVILLLVFRGFINIILPRDAFARYGLVVALVLTLVFSIIGLFFNQFILGGVVRLALHTVKTRQVDISELFGATPFLRQLVFLGLCNTLLFLLALGPGYYLLFSSVAHRVPGNPASVSIGQIVFGLLWLLCASPLACCLLCLSPFLVVDQDMPAIDAISKSASTGMRNFGVMYLGFLALNFLNLLGAVVCIGLLITIPLSILTLAVVYKDLFGVTPIAESPTNPYNPPIADPGSFR